ncbi:MAG: DUF4136 domain-containing protein [Variovorax sp.]
MVAGLCGCTTWVVDSKVQTYSKLAAAPVEPTYRFERLPSQQADEPRQSQLEAMAAAALGRAGFRRDDSGAAYSAQVGAHVLATLSPWADPWIPAPAWGPGFGFGYGFGYGAAYGWPGYGRGWYGPGLYGGGWYAPGVLPPVNPWYEREVRVVLRELRSGQVVYESTARNGGPYNASGPVLAVMFDAALQGFPHPPEGVRRVDIPLPTATR